MSVIFAIARAATAIAATASACGAGADGSGADAAARFDTIAGVVHVTSGERGVWADGGAWRVDTASALRIGVVQGEEPYVFGRISGVYVADDRRIYVGDVQALEVRIFGPAGEFLGRFGREGEGPGEFRHIGGVGEGPDGGVAVLDARLGRLSVFDAEGEFRRAFALERPYMILIPGAPVRFDDAGRFYDLVPISIGIFSADSLAAIRYSPDGTVEDTIVIAVHRPVRVNHERNGVLYMSMPLPFSPRPSAAFGPDGGIYASLGADYHIARFGPAGDTVRVIRREIPPLRLDAVRRESARDAFVERFREAAGVEPRDLPPIPEVAPAISRMVVDDLDHLWVLSGNLSILGDEALPDTMRWDVFDPLGRYLGSLTLPVMNVQHIGEGHIAGIATDELGVQTVVVVPLDRGGADTTR